VVGMHRSGTSAVARVINLLGVPLGDPADLIEAELASNPAGHWESNALMAFNDRLLSVLGGSWSSPPQFPKHWERETEVRRLSSEALETFANVYTDQTWAWKDPRLCLTLPFWRSVLPARTAAIMVVRHPLEVARSLEARNRFPIPRSLQIWETYNASALDGLDGIPVLVTTYEALLKSPRLWAEAAARFLRRVRIPVDVTENFEAFVDPNLRHSSDGVGSLGRPPVTQSQQELYFTLLGLVGTHAPFRAP
jgi:hypothetical protein